MRYMKSYEFRLYFSALMAALGGLLSGYDTGVISGALLYINQTWDLSVSQQGFLVSSVLIGALLGAASNGVLADIFGRKKNNNCHINYVFCRFDTVRCRAKSYGTYSFKDVYRFCCWCC